MGTYPEAVRLLGDRIADLTVREAALLSAYLRTAHELDPRPRLVEPEVIADPERPPPTERTVRLDRYDPARKIQLIKLLRELFQLGLIEAKQLVESGPRVLGGPLAPDDAQRLKARLEEAGATVTLGA